MLHASADGFLAYISTLSDGHSVPDLDYNKMLRATHCQSSCVGSSEERKAVRRIAGENNKAGLKAEKNRSGAANSNSAQGYMRRLGQSFGEI